MEQYLFDSLPIGPFTKLRQLVAGITPRMSVLNMSIGEPKHAFPDFVAPIIAENIAGFGKYPASLGIDSLISANANWLNKRFKLSDNIDKNKHISVLNGTREGLFNAAIMSVKATQTERPIIAMPDPFYQVYAAGAMASQADILFLPTAKTNGFLPDLNAITTEQWQRMCAFYICSPANPQGVFADRTYFETLISLARKYDFYIFSDECYSEIYSYDAPISALEVALENGDFKNVISFYSLSKRSSLPGLRTGFCAGCSNFIKRFKAMRNIAAAQIPEPLQHVAAAAWSDEDHVVTNRNLYNLKLDLCDIILGSRFDYQRPQGGFFLWLNMEKYGGGEKAALDLWTNCGIKALPGAYLSSLAASDNADNRYSDPQQETSSKYLRLALVDDLSNTQTALERMVTYYTNMEASV